MFEISGDNYTDIYLTRGDTASLKVNLYDYDGEYRLQDGDTLTLTVRKSVESDVLVLQLFSDDVCTFHFSHNDTKDIAYGNYVYDIQLNTKEGGVYTVIPVSTFTIGYEVTR